MDSRHRVGFIGLGLMTISLTGSPGALATLGEGVDSVAKDGKAIAAAGKNAASRAQYAVQELVSDATTVREYIDASGIVFAVAWNGLVNPDLKTLLGTYDDEYRDARRQLPRKKGRKSTQVRGERVVVETWGHMRNLRGRAYLPARLPVGVNLNEIQ